MSKKLLPGNNAIVVNADGSLSIGKVIYRPEPLYATPVAGAMEFYDGRFYITGTGKQRVIDRTSVNVNVADVIVGNKNTLETLYTWSLTDADIQTLPELAHVTVVELTAAKN